MSCPKGQIRRKRYYRSPYTRKSGTRVSGSRVPSACVKDMGLPGKTPKSRRVLPKLTPGRLRKFGYGTKKSADTRRRAVKKAVKKDSYASIVRRLVAASNYMKRTAPQSYKAMRSDIKWARTHLAPKYSKSMRRRTTRRRRSSRRRTSRHSRRRRTSKRSRRRRRRSTRKMSAGAKRRSTRRRSSSRRRRSRRSRRRSGRRRTRRQRKMSGGQRRRSRSRRRRKTTGYCPFCPYA